jgi:predicted MPP superfamily phosphohydrolase
VISAWLARAGFHDINNRMAELRRGEKHLNIYGLDDSYFGQPVAPSQIPSDRYCIVMTHNLDAVSSEFPDFTGVVLSGHTHWGELRLFDGAKIMNRWGYCDDLNQHTRGWKALSDNALSFVHPGLARYYVPYQFFRHPPGFVIHTFY